MSRSCFTIVADSTIDDVVANFVSASGEVHASSYWDDPDLVVVFFGPDEATIDSEVLAYDPGATPSTRVAEAEAESAAALGIAEAAASSEVPSSPEAAASA